MGNLNKNDKFIDHYIHPRLGAIQRMQTQNSQQIIQYIVAVQNLQIFKDWEQNILPLLKQNKSALFLPTQYVFQKSGMCGSGGDVRLLYKDYMFLLSEEIQNRTKIKRPFAEAELWYILYSIIKAQALLESKNMKIGGISTKNVLVNQDGEMQIISQHSWPNCKNNFIQDYGQLHKAVISYNQSEYNPETSIINQYYYLSPEQIEFKNKNIKISQNNYNFSQSAVTQQNLCFQNFKRNQKQRQIQTQILDRSNISQMFTIGLLLLETSSLKNCLNLYEINKNKNTLNINYFILNQYLQSLQGKYSPNFIWFIRQMTRKDSEYRIKAHEAQAILQPYSQKILKLEQFSINVIVDDGSYRKNNSKISIANLQRRYSKNNIFENEQAASNYTFVNKNNLSRNQKISVNQNNSRVSYTPTHYYSKKVHVPNNQCNNKYAESMYLPATLLLGNYEYAPMMAYSLPLYVLPSSKQIIGNDPIIVKANKLSSRLLMQNPRNSRLILQGSSLGPPKLSIKNPTPRSNQSSSCSCFRVCNGSDRRISTSGKAFQKKKGQTYNINI